MAGQVFNNDEQGMSLTEAIASGSDSLATETIACSPKANAISDEELRELSNRATSIMLEASRLGVYLAVGLLAAAGLVAQGTQSATKMWLIGSLFGSVVCSGTVHLAYGHAIQKQIRRYIREPSSLVNRLEYIESVFWFGGVQALLLCVGALLLLLNV